MNLGYVMDLNKNYLWKIFTEDEFEKINYVGRHSAARLSRGFQTRPKGSESRTSNCLIPSLTLHQLSHWDPQEKG